MQPNSPDAVADVPNEHGYYILLDQHCEDLKAVVGGGIGWFAHIYSDDQEPGYGIYDDDGNLKFPSWVNRGLDTDVIVSEVRETSRKPEEVYGLIERMCPGGRKIEIFGRKHNTRPGYVDVFRFYQGGP